MSALPSSKGAPSPNGRRAPAPALPLFADEPVNRGTALDVPLAPLPPIAVVDDGDADPGQWYQSAADWPDWTDDDNAELGPWAEPAAPEQAHGIPILGRVTGPIGTLILADEERG